VAVHREQLLCSHPTTQRPTTATNHIQQNQRSTPYAVTHGLCSPEDGHNDARNMLRQKLLINIWLLHLVGFLSLHTLWDIINCPLYTLWRYIPTAYVKQTCCFLSFKTLFKTQNETCLQDKLIIYLRHTSPSAVRMYGGNCCVLHVTHPKVRH